MTYSTVVVQTWYRLNLREIEGSVLPGRQQFDARVLQR